MTIEPRKMYDDDGSQVNVLAVDDIAQLGPIAKSLGYSTTSDWAGDTLAGATKKARDGDLPRAASSDALLSKMENLIDLSGLRRVTVNAVAGGVPNVPAMLAGHPCAMRVRRKVASDKSALTVFVRLNALANVPHENIERRGAALLALVRAVSTVRPVTLYAGSAYTDGGRHVIAARIETAPLDLARAAWTLGSPAALRQLVLGVQGAVAPNPDYFFTGSPDLNNDSINLFLDAEGATGPRVITARLTGDEPEFQTDDQAAEWLRGQVAQYGGL